MGEPHWMRIKGVKDLAVRVVQCESRGWTSHDELWDPPLADPFQSQSCIGWVRFALENKGGSLGYRYLLNGDSPITFISLLKVL